MVERSEQRPERCLLCEARTSNPVCQLPAPSVLKFAEVARTLEFQNGQPIFQQGDPAGDVVLIRFGSIKLTHEHSDGAEQILRIAGPGETLGIGMSIGPVLLATASARGSVSICRIALGEVERIVKDDPEFALAWAHLLMDEIQRARISVLHLGRHPAGMRLARFLVDSLEQSKPRQGAVVPTLYLTHSEIASTISIADETSTRLLRDMEEKNVLRLARGRIEIIDMDRLLALAGYRGTFSDPLLAS